MSTKKRGAKSTGTAKPTSKPRSPRKPRAAAPALEPPPAPAPTPPAPAEAAPKAAGRGRKAPSAPPPAPVPPPSGPRHAIFIDVENTSSEAALSRLLDELQIDLTTGTTEVTAIGNWRLAGPRLGRSLAHRGAALVHSAPAARVSDWSDLWIAVQAGIWLGRARPGDALDIISHDRAFDAVGDAAARLGVTFRRLTYHGAGASGARVAPAPDEEEVHEHPGRRRSRRGRGRGAGPGRPAASGRPGAPSRAPAPPRPPQPRAPAPGGAFAPPAPASPPGAAPGAPAGGVPHGATEARLRQIIARLTATDPSRTVTLDALTLALKAAGFQRPPGSPRLVTRLRQTRGIEVLPNSRVRLVDDAAPAAEPRPADPPPPDDEWRRRKQFKPGA